MHPLRLPSSVTGLIPPWRPGIKLRGPDLGQGARLSGRETFHVGGGEACGRQLAHSDRLCTQSDRTHEVPPRGADRAVE